MSATLDVYLEAVAKRKSIDRRGPSPCVNFAIVSQLEDGDIPLLTEIIRVFDAAIREAMEEFADGSPTTALRRCQVRVEELAAQGSTARWGDYRKENGSGG